MALSLVGFSLLTPTLFAFAALTAGGIAQCDPQWALGAGLPGTNGSVNVTATWDPDGPGPLNPVLVVGGSFTIIGNVAANRVATWDPVTDTWSALGTGVIGGSTPVVAALATLPNGDLVVGGNFTHAGGLSVRSIAKWNGTSWSPLGTGFVGTIGALAVLGNGDLAAGGYFTQAGGVFANSIARWNGTAWSAIGSGFGSTPGSGQNGSVDALVVMPNGDLVACGFFHTAGGVSAANVARWNGVAWAPIGSGISPSYFVTDLALMPNGDLVACGTFASAWGGPGNRVARWDGTAWLPLGSGVDSNAYALAVMPNGDLIAAGTFQNAGAVPAARVARWDGVAWSALGSGCDANVFSLGLLPNGELVAGGQFTTAGGRACGGIALWNGTAWSPAAQGTDAEVAALLDLPGGALVAGGSFTAIGGADAQRVAHFDGQSWSALGAGFDGPVRALARMPNGDFVAAGLFAASGATPVANVARWNGAAWLPLGAGVGGAVDALAVLPNGDLVAGGQFNSAGGAPANRVAAWNGSTWSTLSTGVDGMVASLLVRSNGNLVAGGVFAQAGGQLCKSIASWDGVSWSPLGTGFTGPFSAVVGSLAELPNGNLVAGGWFTTAGGVNASRIARWNGASWSPLGTGISGTVNVLVEAMRVLPNGELLVAGEFAQAGGVTAPNVARWNGSAWSPVDGGTDGPVRCLATLTNGDVVAGGVFFQAGGAISSRLARLASPCPASVATVGAGCAGSGGLNVLTATSLPWTGSTFTSLATGMPNNALAVGVLGLTAISVPLPSILPQGVPGCTLFASPDLLELYVPAAGSVQTQLVLPNTVALAGVVLHQQVVPIELSGTGSITALTGTNALTLTIGSF